MTTRIVLDTNVWLDWLVFADPCVTPIREAQAAGRVEICMTAEGEAELVRVLGYERGKRTLAHEAQVQCIERCRSLARRIDTRTADSERGRLPLPLCRDRDDQKFLEAALVADAQFLVTKDKALLELAKARAKLPAPFRIVTPKAFAAALPED